MKGSVLSNGKISVNRTVDVSVLVKFSFLWGDRENTHDREQRLLYRVRRYGEE